MFFPFIRLVYCNFVLSLACSFGNNAHEKVKHVDENTENSVDSDISKDLDGVGAIFNAFTGKDYTGYYVKVDDFEPLIGAKIKSVPFFNLTKSCIFLSQNLNLKMQNHIW